MRRRGVWLRGVLTAAVLLMARVGVALADVTATTKTASQQQREEAVRFSQTLFWSLIVLLAFFFAALAIIVFSRRFRTFLTGGRRNEPTPSEDVWRMHKPPPEVPLDPDDEDGA